MLAAVLLDNVVISVKQRVLRFQLVTLLKVDVQSAVYEREPLPVWVFLCVFPLRILFLKSLNVIERL